MPGEIFIYIGSIFVFTFYATDFYSIYSMNLKAITSSANVNTYSIKFRICSLCGNICFVAFNLINNITIAIYGNSIFLSMDVVLLLIRLYYAYYLYKLSKNMPENQSIILPKKRQSHIISTQQNPLFSNATANTNANIV